MAQSSRLKFLPLGKKYHIFFFHVRHKRDQEWVKDVINNLSFLGFHCGSSIMDFEAEFSIFENVERRLNEAQIISHVISNHSMHCQRFEKIIQMCFMKILEQSEKTGILPIVLDNSKVPFCLNMYEPLVVEGSRDEWWPKLIKVLRADNPSSSSDESDEECTELYNQMLELAVKKSLKKQKYFHKLCRKSALNNFISQRGTAQTHLLLMKGCGVEINQNTGTLVLKLDRFESILTQSPDTLVEIVQLNQDVKLVDVTLYLPMNLQAQLSEGGQHIQAKLVEFLEQSLNVDFHTGEFDRMTYNVVVEGLQDYPFLKTVNNIVRHLYLEHYQQYSSRLDTDEKRLKTFLTWPYSTNQIPSIARAGFVYSGIADTVTCFACNQSLYGIGRFQNLDFSHLHDVEVMNYICQHLMWNENCPFVRQFQISSTNISNIISIDNDFTVSKMSVSERTSRNRRIIMGKTFPESITAENLAEEGFILTLDTLNVICTECNCRLTNIKSIDDLQERHLLWSGDECPYLLERKGIEEIKKFRRDHDLPTQFRTSVTFKTILIRKSLTSPIEHVCIEPSLD